MKRPVDGTIIIKVGDLTAKGKLGGLTVAKARELVLAQLPDPSVLPADAVARIATMAPDDDAWKKLPSPEQEVLVSCQADGGVQLFQCVSKEAPDDYVIRPADIFLEFLRPQETA